MRRDVFCLATWPYKLVEIRRVKQLRFNCVEYFYSVLPIAILPGFCIPGITFAGDNVDSTYKLWLWCSSYQQICTGYEKVCLWRPRRHFATFLRISNTFRWYFNSPSTLVWRTDLKTNGRTNILKTFSTSLHRSVRKKW